MTIHPQHDRILIKRDDSDEMSPGGIIYVDQTRQEKPLRGKIVAIGPGRKLVAPLMPKGYVLDPIDFTVGQHVLFTKYAGESYKFGGEELFFVKAEDVIGVIDDDDEMDSYINGQLQAAGYSEGENQ